MQPRLPHSSVCLGRSSPGPTPPLSSPTSPWLPPWEHRADDSRLLATIDGRRPQKNPQGSAHTSPLGPTFTPTSAPNSPQVTITNKLPDTVPPVSAVGCLSGSCLLKKHNCDDQHPGDCSSQDPGRERERSPAVPELCHLAPEVTAGSHER